MRAYDIERHTLLQKPMIDPREPDETMRGLPVTRTMSPDGRWAYTLYDRSPDAPFIHALDTLAAAFCIDLPQGSSDVFDMKLSLAGGALRVVNDGTPVALVNTTTFAVAAGRGPGATGQAQAALASGGRRRLPLGARGAAGRGGADGRSAGAAAPAAEPARG